MVKDNLRIFISNFKYNFLLSVSFNDIAFRDRNKKIILDNSVNVKGEIGDKFLAEACEKKKMKMMELLIDNGAEIDNRFLTNLFLLNKKEIYKILSYII